MKNKIDKSLLHKIIALNEKQDFSVLILTHDITNLCKSLEYKNINNFTKFEFINAVGLSLDYPQLMELSNSNIVEYITSYSKVFAQMDTVRNTININQFHDEGILGQGKRVAIIDTGIAPHLDFLSYENRIVKFVDFIDDKRTIYDDNGHGTFVSGVLAGNGFSSGKKYCGIAPKAEIIMLKALDKNGEASAYNILKAMEWLFDNALTYNIDVICMSFGSEPFERNDPLVLGAEALMQKDVLVIAAAGNSGPQPRTIKSPGVSNKVLTVGGANDRSDTVEFTIPNFSSRGPAFSFFKPDLVAPAVKIISTACQNLDKASYTEMSGTSVATPIVAGSALLVKQKYPNLSAMELKNYLTKHTILLPFMIGGGKNIQGNGVLHFN